MSDIIKEKFIKEQLIQVSIKKKKKILFQMENCICKINLENDQIGIGYFCKIPSNNNTLLPVLITNNNVFKDKYNKIKLTINNFVKEIKIDKSRKKYINPQNNMLIIEIKPNKDKIFNYLELDENDIYKNKENLELEYKNKAIYYSLSKRKSYCIIWYKK